MSAFVCAAAVFAAGCHNNNNDSNYGIGFVTLTSQPGPFSSYIVNVDSITLTGVHVGVITAVSTVETVDFTKLNNLDELWDAASIPDDTYTRATLTLDYSAANISVLVNGVPVKCTVRDPNGAAITTVAVTVNLAPANPLVLDPTYATTSGKRLAVDFDLGASNVVSLVNSPPYVVVRPFITMATSADDTNPIRVRGPLTNSSLHLGTYTVYVRPFYDEVDSLGQLTIFNTADTVYLINGTYYQGTPGISVLSQLSAGTTVTAAYTTYKPTATPTTTAAIFYSTYVVAGSTLEDYYTQGLEGDVIARNGNTLTVRGATLSLNDGTSQYIETPDSVILLGSGTIVTADDNTTLTGLTYDSIAVGQHIVARGIYELPASGVVTLDATGTSSTNTGSVRIISTKLFGSLVSSATGSLVMDLQTINNFPASVYNFSGNGATSAENPIAADYVVNTGALAPPADTFAGEPIWVNGFATSFGTAPPDFMAFSIPAEPNVPATLVVRWDGGTTKPFETLTDANLAIDLDNPAYYSGIITIGSEMIDLKSLPATPLIMPAIATAPSAPGLPSVFLPRFSIGNPLSASTTSTSTATITTAEALSMFNDFPSFVTELGTLIVPADPVLKITATGVYNRGTNTFTASVINVVL